MIDVGEARRIALASLGGLDGPDDLLLEEYEDGYVARGKPDEEVNADGLPRSVGQGCVVIDKADGTVHGMPYVGPGTIEYWRRDKAAGKI